MHAIVVYDDIKDKELLDKIDLGVPFFIDYVNTEIKHYKQEVIYGRTSISSEEKTDNNQ